MASNLLISKSISHQQPEISQAVPNSSDAGPVNICQDQLSSKLFANLRTCEYFPNHPRGNYMLNKVWEELFIHRKLQRFEVEAGDLLSNLIQYIQQRFIKLYMLRLQLNLVNKMATLFPGITNLISGSRWRIDGHCLASRIPSANSSAYVSYHLWNISCDIGSHRHNFQLTEQRPSNILRMDKFHLWSVIILFRSFVFANWRDDYVGIVFLNMNDKATCKIFTKA